MVSRAKKEKGKAQTLEEHGDQVNRRDSRAQHRELTRFEVDFGGMQQAFLTIIPRWQHKDARCMCAKEKVLNCWSEFNAYEDVKDKGQKNHRFGIDSSREID